MASLGAWMSQTIGRFTGGRAPWAAAGAPKTGSFLAPPQAVDNIKPRKRNSNWLYEWSFDSQPDSTMFVNTIGRSPYQYTLGHPWCAKGYGESMAVAMTKLIRSDVALRLMNAADTLDNSGNALLWDNVSQNDTDTVVDLDETQKALATGVLGPAIQALAKKFLDSSDTASKMRSITELACQLSDAEAEAKVWEDSVYFCFFEDIIAATLICGESELDIDCPKLRTEFAHTKEDFPSEACVVDSKILQAQLPGFGDEPLLSATPPKEDGRVFFDFNRKEPVPLLLYDLLSGTAEGMLPRYISPEVTESESLTYLVLYRSNIIAASFSHEPYLCGANEIQTPSLLPGWDLPLVVNIMPEGNPMFARAGDGIRNDAIPLGFISHSPMSPCSFVISFRGTASMFEWTSDFTYAQTPSFSNSKTLTHSGFTRLLTSVAPSIEHFLSATTYRYKCSCDETNILLTGHSLGAGVAQLMALHLAERYLGCQRSTAKPIQAGAPGPDGKRDSGRGVDISAVVFGPPRVFNEYGAERYRRLVNGRVIFDIADGLAYIPCSVTNAEHGWPRCPAGHMAPSGKGRDYYADNYGIIEISVDYQSVTGGRGIDALMQTVFPSAREGEPSTIGMLLSKAIGDVFPSANNVPSLGALGAAHICSAACKFGQTACGKNFKWWCDACPALL